MSTVVYECGCWISTSMFDDASVIGIGVCFEHSLDPRIHEARKQQFRVAGGQEFPLNFQDPDVQGALVCLAFRVREMQEEKSSE